jgi:hypothetical protein
MIKMLVHQNGPLVRRELAEKTVWVFGAAIRPGGNEPTHQSEQSLSFDFQISPIFHDELLNCWRISAPRFVVSEDHRLYHPPNESALSGGIKPAQHYRWLAASAAYWEPLRNYKRMLPGDCKTGWWIWLWSPRLHIDARAGTAHSPNAVRHYPVRKRTSAPTGSSAARRSGRAG